MRTAATQKPSVMEITGSVMGTTNTTQITNLGFDLTLAAGGDSVNLDPNATNNKTIISYLDPSNSIADVAYTTTVVVGDGDNQLEQGELFEINIDFTGGQFSSVTLGTNKTFTIELKPPSGSYLVIQRTTPASLAQSVVNMN